MANNSLGSISVSLRADTASFAGDLGKAARAAENLGRDINKSFSGLARIASNTFGAFGPAANQAISTISTAIAQVGRAAAASAKDLGKMGGAMGLIGAAGAGVATALGLVAFGALEIARRTSESIDKLNEQAQALSIDIEALSSLGLAAKQSGISQEGLGKALQGMSRSAFAASQAAEGAENAYTRLGIKVTHQGGAFKTQLELFREISSKLAAMGKDFNKTAEAGNIFGRGIGSAILPLVNLGDQLDETIETSQKLGLVITKETAVAADRFQDTLKEVGGAVEGLKIKLTASLLPAMQQAASSMQRWLADPRNVETLEAIAQGAATAGRALLNTANAALFFGRAMVALREFGKGAFPTPTTFREFISEIREAKEEAQEYWSVQNIGSADFHSAMRNSGREALRQRQDALKLVGESAGEAQKKIDSFIDSLRDSNAEFGKSAGWIAEYKANILGASDAELVFAHNIAQRNFVMAQSVKAMPKPTERTLPEFDPTTIPAPKIEQLMPKIDLGLIGHFNTLEESLKAQAKTLNQENRPAIEKYRDAMELLMATQKDSGLSSQAFAVEVDKLKQQFLSTDPIILTVKQSMSEMFSQAIFRAGSLREAFGNLLSRIGEVIFQVNVLDPLLKNLGTGGGGGGGILGFLGGIGKSILGGLIPGGGAVTSAFNPSTYTFKQIPFMAGGGNVSAGRPYVVGDDGPELFVPSSSGRIMANGQAAGGVSIVYNVDARGATDPAATAMAVQRAIQQSEERSVQRAKGEYLELLRRTPSGSFA